VGHLPSGKFTANGAWLVLAVIAFNLTRTAATLTGPVLAKATTGTIRRTLITIPARIASSARRVTLHLPTAWPWQTGWTRLFNNTCGSPTPTTSLPPSRTSARPTPTRGTPRTARSGTQPRPHTDNTPPI